MTHPIFYLLGFLNFSQAQVQNFPSEVFQYEIVKFQPQKGYHFELAATQSCSGAEVIERSKGLIQCQMLEVGKSKVQLNICDDKKTFCKPHEFELTVTSAPKGFKSPPLKKGLVEMKEYIHQELLPGFENLMINEAMAKAKKENRPVLVLISTDWCPPCNQSKEYLLSTMEFQEFTKDWLKVYVDGDSSESLGYDEKLSFFEYPSFILVNSDFQEVSRFRQELSFEEFKNWWERAKPYLGNGYEKTKKKVVARKEEGWFQRAQDLLLFTSKKEQKKDLHFVIETAIAKNDSEFLRMTELEDVPDFLREDWLSTRHDDLVPTALSEVDFNLKALEHSGLTPSFVYHLKEVCRLKLPECESGQAQLPKRPKLILARTNRSRAENLAALADEYYAQVDFYKGLGRKKESMARARLCVDTFESLAKLSELKFPRYAMQGVLACAKEFDLGRVEKMYLSLIEKYPEDPTFIDRYARFLKNEKKDLKQAKVWVNKALDKSYDYNWFYAASLKVQISQALGEEQNAQDTIKQAFARLSLNANKDSRNQKVLSRFRQLEQSLMESK